MLDELQELLDGTLHIDLPTRLLFCRDGSTGRQVPSGVFRPASKADLRKLVPLASARQIPLSVRGGGTGKSGGCLTGGLVVDLGATLNRVTYDPETKWGGRLDFRPNGGQEVLEGFSPPHPPITRPVPGGTFFSPFYRGIFYFQREWF
jgi:hypothetical protein